MRLTKVAFLFALVALVAAPIALALRFTDESFNTPTGVTGQPYSHQFNGAAGCGPALPYQYRLLDSSLPPGLVLDKGGLIHGVPTQGGDYSFWVELSDENPPSASWCIPSTAQRQFTIKVVPGINILQNALNPKVAFLNRPYPGFQLSASGVSGAQTWSLKSGALPPGMSVGPNGVVSGTPTAAGDFTFVIQVTDGGRSDSETYTLNVVEELKITQAKAPLSEVGQPFVLQLKATGGRPALVWSLADGTALPAGLTLDAATGLIGGKPTVAGSYPLKLTVTDQLGLTQNVDVTVAVAAKLAVVKKALPVVKIGKLYKGRLTAHGGATPLKWRILGGRPGFLPAGIKLNAKTGEFSGIASGKTGLYRLRMQATDKLGVKASLPIVLKVVA
jgi:hypothetical protein